MIWLMLLPPWAIINLVAYLGAPILGLIYESREGFCDNGNSTGVEPRLPVWLSWFATPDNSLVGDSAWKRMEADHWAWRSKLSSWPVLQAYLGRVGWLMRNPAYGFERSILAATILPTDSVVSRGDPFVQNSPNGRDGYCFVRIGNYWNLVYIKRIGERCIKVNLGWKLKTYAEDPSRVLTEPIAQYVLSPRLAAFVEA